MWCSDRRGVFSGAALALAVAAAGCGFTPLYAPGAPATEALGRVAVAQVDGEAGFALRERLVQRLGAADAPTHRLEVALDLERRGVAITQRNVITRFNVIGAAAYRLAPLAAEGSALAGNVRAITGYSAPDSETASAFASLAARRDAELRLARLLADQIAVRLALSAAEWGG